MKHIKYTDLRPGDTISWDLEVNGDKISQFGIIKNFHVSFIDPIGVIETMNGKMIHRSKAIYKIIADQKIHIDK